MLQLKRTPTATTLCEPCIHITSQKSLSPCRLCKGAWDPAFAGREPGRRRHYLLRRDKAHSPSSADPTTTPPLHTARHPPGTEEHQRPRTRDEADEKKKK